MLTNRTLPSPVKVGPQNSESLSWLRATAYVGTPGKVPSTWEAPAPSSASTRHPHWVTVTLSGPSKVRSAYLAGAPTS